MQFPQKIVILMRKNGLTTRSLGAAVGVNNGTVAGWTKGAQPRPEAATKLAEHFGLPVEVLLDDTKELPEAQGRSIGVIYRQVEEAPTMVREGFHGPIQAELHYRALETLFDTLLKEREGKRLSPEELLDFREMLRSFIKGREKGRKALFAALKLANDSGTFMLGQHMAIQQLQRAAEKEDPKL